MRLTKVLGLAVIGALMALAAPAERANALSLNNPAAAAAVQQDAKPATTEVHWRRHHHRHYHHRWHRPHRHHFHHHRHHHPRFHHHRHHHHRHWHR